MLSLSLPCLSNFVTYISGEGFILPLNLNYICFCIDIFVRIITDSLLLFLCILFNIIFSYTSYWYLVLYLSCVLAIPPLRHCSICVCFNMLVNVISMVTSICLCTSYDLLLGCATS